MTKKVVQSLWVGDRLSVIEQLALASFVAHGHEFHLYAYNRVEGVPNGVVRRDANELLPEAAIFTTHGGSYAMFSDWFRWKLLCERGGYWVDMDVVCLRPFDFSDELVFGRENIYQVNTAVLSVPAGHKLAELMLSSAVSPYKSQVFDNPKIRRRKFRSRLLGKSYQAAKWGHIAGPRGFTRALAYLGLEGLAKSHLAFYPVSALNWDAIFDETYASGMGALQDSYGLHLWNEMMRRAPGFDKNGRFPANSLIEQLKAAYLK